MFVLDLLFSAKLIERRGMRADWCLNSLLMHIHTKRLPHSSLFFRSRTECNAYGIVRIATISSMRKGDGEFSFYFKKEDLWNRLSNNV